MLRVQNRTTKAQLTNCLGKISDVILRPCPADVTHSFSPSGLKYWQHVMLKVISGVIVRY